MDRVRRARSYITEMRLRLYDELAHCNWNAENKRDVLLPTAHCPEIALAFAFCGAVDANDSLDFNIAQTSLRDGRFSWQELHYCNIRRSLHTRITRLNELSDA